MTSEKHILNIDVIKEVSIIDKVYKEITLWAAC